MDAVILALGKAYTDSQRLAYEVKTTLTFDGDTTGKELCGFAENCCRISNSYIDPDTITKLVLCNANGELVEADLSALTKNGQEMTEGGETLRIWMLSDTTDICYFVSLEVPPSAVADFGTSGTFVYYSDDWYVCLVEAETVVPIDPKFIPSLDSLTLNSPGGKQFKLTCSDDGALTCTEVTP